jgi:hypothetical protein
MRIRQSGTRTRSDRALARSTRPLPQRREGAANIYVYMHTVARLGPSVHPARTRRLRCRSESHFKRRQAAPGTVLGPLSRGECQCACQTVPFRFSMPPGGRRSSRPASARPAGGAFKFPGHGAAVRRLAGLPVGHASAFPLKLLVSISRISPLVRNSQGPTERPRQHRGCRARTSAGTRTPSRRPLPGSDKGENGYNI